MVVVSRYTDTDIGIRNAEKYRIPTNKYRRYRNFGIIFNMNNLLIARLAFLIPLNMQRIGYLNSEFIF